MIPCFPEFKKMTLEDRVEMEKYVQKFLPYSDFNFISLWVYDTEDDIIVSYLNGNLVIRLRDYITNKHIFSFLGTHKIIETTKTLIDWSHKHHGVASLKLIPEVVLTSDPSLGKKFEVTEDKDSFDYILSTSQMSTLTGKDFKSKRKLVNAFHKTYPHHIVKEITILDPKIKDEMILLFQTWTTVKNKISEDSAHELVALNRLLRHAHQFNLITIAIYIENKMIGFSVVELVHESYAVNHFMKMDSTYKGISETLDKITGQILHKKGYHHFNIEQDLGLVGLKKSKTLCRPIHYLKKYIIKPKGTV